MGLRASPHGHPWCRLLDRGEESTNQSSEVAPLGSKQAVQILEKLMALQQAADRKEGGEEEKAISLQLQLMDSSAQTDQMSAQLADALAEGGGKVRGSSKGCESAEVEGGQIRLEQQLAASIEEMRVLESRLRQSEEERRSLALESQTVQTELHDATAEGEAHRKGADLDLGVALESAAATAREQGCLKQQLEELTEKMHASEVSLSAESPSNPILHASSSHFMAQAPGWRARTSHAGTHTSLPSPPFPPHPPLNHRLGPQLRRRGVRTQSKR